MNGCDKYDVRAIRIYFPAGHVCCDFCPLLETYARKQCRGTGEYLLDTKGTGMWCPLYNNEKENRNEPVCE